MSLLHATKQTAFLADLKEKLKQLRISDFSQKGDEEVLGLIDEVLGRSWEFLCDVYEVDYINIR